MNTTIIGMVVLTVLDLIVFDGLPGSVMILDEEGSSYHYSA